MDDAEADSSVSYAGEIKDDRVNSTMEGEGENPGEMEGGLGWGDT